MVLVQEDEEIHEHVIYYLSRNLIDVEIRYSHVEKLVLILAHDLGTKIQSHQRIINNYS